MLSHCSREAPHAMGQLSRSDRIGARHVGRMSRQTIRYLITSDGVRMAWAEAGSGSPLVKASNWLSHLEFDRESLVWRPWMRFVSDHFRLVRYDERGCGLTDWDAAALWLARRPEDPE